MKTSNLMHLNLTIQEPVLAMLREICKKENRGSSNIMEGLIVKEYILSCKPLKPIFGNDKDISNEVDFTPYN